MPTPSTHHVRSCDYTSWYLVGHIEHHTMTHEAHRKHLAKHHTMPSQVM